MALSDQILVIGLTPRGGAHILYCGTESERAKLILSQAGPEFEELALYEKISPTATRTPSADAGTRRAGQLTLRRLQMEGRAARAQSFREQLAQRREVATSRQQERRDALSNLQGATPLQQSPPAPSPESPSPAAASELSSEETK